jgi:predicted short-subunit dehydrogenase-like oxidoreductase (DUF2520 family)
LKVFVNYLKIQRLKMSSRLNVAVIGAGSVGLAMAKAISNAGHTIMAIATTDQERAEQVATMLPGVLIAPVADAIDGADLVIFAIPGSEIKVLVRRLIDTSSLSRGQLLAHTSAELGYEVFADAYEVGIVPMAIHPAIIFTGVSSVDRTRLMDSYIAVDAPKSVLPVVQTLAIEIGGEPVHVPASSRAKYAEAISVASSFTSLIVGQAITLLEDANIEKARNILSAIMRSALEESLRSAVLEIDPSDLLDEEL